MALAPTTTLPSYPSHTLSLPLTTAWTAPPACATALPRFSQGTCVGTVCVADQNPNTELTSAWINWPYRTDLQSLTATDCQPPGFNDRYLFAYISATACPSGYVTGTSRTWPYDIRVSAVTCCPIHHTLLLSAPVFTDAYGSTTWRGDCATVRTLTSGAPYIGVAVGFNTQLVQTVVSGTTITTTTEYYTESVIATKTVSGSAIQVVVGQPYVQVLVPRSGALATPASTSSSADSSSSSSSKKNSFSVFGLSFVLSIVATAGLGIGSLIFLCCAYSILSRCCRGGRRSSSSSRRYVPPPLPPPAVYSAASAAVPPTTYNPPSSSSSTCPHSRSTLCSYRRSYESTCCACKDSRPSSPDLTIHARTSTYCYACQAHFRSLPVTSVPPAWRTEADLDRLVEEIMEQRKCRHGVVAVICSRTADESRTCCACVDPRPTAGAAAALVILTQQQRADGYCGNCKEYFEALEPQECPAEWRLAEVDCAHGYGTSKSCTNPLKSSGGGAGGRFEAACCVCKDTRLGFMPRRDRTALYCPSCREFLDRVEVERLPASWGIKCGHEDRYLGCKGACAAGRQCCACVDGRTGLMSKRQRLEGTRGGGGGGGYCDDCKAYWYGVADAHCPKVWLLKCRHGRANAWEVQSMQGTPVGRRPPTTGATGSCCCACRDTRTGFLTKINRIKKYCRDCKAWWSSKADHELPPEWQLSCRHGGMGAWCLATGPNNTSQCCACLDTGRTKNMTKFSRLKTYCTNCQNAWWGTPDQQCPPEWNLLAPRTDCKHSMAMECMMSPPGGETWCCACKDGRKFLALPHRLSTYCVPCGTHWSQEAAKGNFPVGWAVTMKDIPIIFQKEGCLPRKPKVEYPFENEDKYQNIFDEGPRHGPPRFADGRSEAVELPANPAGKTTRVGNSNCQQNGIGLTSVTVTLPSPMGPDPDYTGYDEKGLQRGAPRFAVAPDPTWSAPLSEKSAPAAVPMSSQPPKPAADKAAIRAEKQRRKEQAGLCKGREPVFQVPPD